MYQSNVYEIQWVCEKLEEYDSLNNKHDKGYKYLLSVKKIFLQLLQSFINQGWVKKIDEDGIILVDKSFILQDFKDKEADLVYRVKMDGKEVVFYILLELQSTVDFQIPYRLLLYMVEIWRSILKDAGKEGERKDFKLPAIIPCVLYNGRNNWTVCRSFKETLEASQYFGEYILDFKYILFDVNRYDETALLELTNLIGTAFYIDQNSGQDEIFKRLDKLIIQFSALDEEEQKILFMWLKNVILKGVPREKAEKFIKEVENRKEGINMIYALEEAIRNGFKSHEEKGMEKVILMILSQRIHDIPDIYRKRIEQLDGQKLEQIAKAIFTIEKAEDIDKYL